MLTSMQAQALIHRAWRHHGLCLSERSPVSLPLPELLREKRPLSHSACVKANKIDGHPNITFSVPGGIGGSVFEEIDDFEDPEEEQVQHGERQEETPEPRNGKLDRSEKRRQPTKSPSSSLIRALHQTGKLHALPMDNSQMPDLSYNNPRSVAAEIQEGLTSSKGAKRWFQESQELVALQKILANYILRRFPRSDAPGSADTWNSTTECDRSAGATPLADEEIGPQLLLESELRTLEQQGYTAPDVALWSFILSAKNAHVAAKAVFASSRPRQATGANSTRPVPTFVFLFLLRREYLPVSALRLLLLHALDRVPANRKTVPDEPNADRNGALAGSALKTPCPSEQDVPSIPVLDETTAFIIFARLLRHALAVWPRAIEAIAQLLLKYLAGLRSENLDASEKEYASRISFSYNRALQLISRPASIHPMRSSAYQERAQFDVLRRMNEFTPPLSISREGYRAVARVQLARKKSEQEMEWARLKSKSWPPWKEDRTGMDADKGIDYGLSQATHVIRRMREAGYGDRLWEKVANIFAGWDTDQSPTIQTRKLPVDRRLERQRVSAQGEQLQIWAARVEATRTIQEAWALFLSYESSKLPPAQDVYLAMFKRIDAEERRLKSDSARDDRFHAWNSEADEVLPGDRRETFPAPINPAEGVYVPSPPPSIDELFDRMISTGLRPTGRLLRYLLRHADDLSQLVKFLRFSRHSTAEKVLLSPEIDDSELKQFPSQTIAAFIQGLCRCSGTLSTGTFADLQTQHILGYDLRKFHPAVHAYRLLELRKPMYRPAWFALIEALGRSKVVLLNLRHGTPPALNDIVAAIMIRQVVVIMRKLTLDIDDRSFSAICDGAARAAQSALRIRNSTAHQMSAWDLGSVYDTEALDDLSHSSRAMKEADEFLSRGSLFLRSLFQSVVEGRASLPTPATDHNLTRTIPRLVDAPHPSVLHAYVRALGFLKDYEGIFWLVKWMVDHHVDLRHAMEESKGAKRHLRILLCAIRVFLERSWGHDFKVKLSDPDKLASRAPEELVMLVREHIESVPEWGGWPVDEEAEEYWQIRKQHVF